MWYRCSLEVVFAAAQVGAGLDVEHGQRLCQPVVVVLRVRELLEDCLGHMLHLQTRCKVMRLRLESRGLGLGCHPHDGRYESLYKSSKLWRLTATFCSCCRDKHKLRVLQFGHPGVCR